MSTPEQHVEVVDDDGSVSVHLSAQTSPVSAHTQAITCACCAPTRPPAGPVRKALGVLVSKIPAEGVLTWEDFEAGHRATVEAAERRYGALG